jgi:rhodanese-related sulfurtransferase
VVLTRFFSLDVCSRAHLITATILSLGAAERRDSMWSRMVLLLTIEMRECSLFPMDHSPAFLKLVNAARPHVKEITTDQARERLAQNSEAVLMDVREDLEWQRGHATEAVHLGKGILERDLEQMFPDTNQEIIMYCGGGYRSVLTAKVAQKMGYRNVSSLIGGHKALIKANWPMKS